MTNLPLPSGHQEPPVTISGPSLAVPASPDLLAIVCSDLTPIERKRLDRFKRIYEPGGRLHLIWTGPVRPDTGLPFVHRWRGKKNVAVHRILWHAVRIDSPLQTHHRLRRLASCAHPLCVHPGCFELASTEMEPQSFPDYLTRPVDIMRSFNERREHRRVNVSALPDQLQDRYIYHGDEVAVRCECDCGSDCTCITHIPVCQQGHILLNEWTKTHESRMQMMGRQYRCSKCTSIINAAKLLRGSRPRAGFRPTSPQHNNIEREYELMEAQFRDLDTGEVIGPGAVDDDEREMQEMERAFREMPVEPDD